MAIPITFQGELRLPATFLRATPEFNMEEIEWQLQRYGLLPVQAQDRRWRMDPDTPGGYLLQYAFVLPETP